ncbi:sensor histidine kinase [Fusibacter ferrireducens]|uniref:histidine kinase n=1 Tax=Fusibacter ferrireducens TaxID=2785058 RepID=A0ABR9ZXC7_9FIRM|nr:ATP-binding protein [Fusibacter ferrireducens]MBF4695111.1 HAMP domain-containing protein [Fusibacter ferrireducens]
MKSFIVRRIILLMTSVIVLSSIIIGVLGVFLSEDFIGDVRDNKFVPDLSLIAENVKQFQLGKMSKETLIKIISKSSESSSTRYFVFDSDRNLTYSSDDSNFNSIENKDFNSKLTLALTKIFSGEKVAYKVHMFANKPIEIVGVPILIEDVPSGAVVVISEMVDIELIRNQYFSSLIMSTLIVLPLVVVFSYFILQRIVRPIRNITQVALSILDGDFSIKADESVEGEFGFLGKTMNILSANLYKSLSQLYIEKNRLNQVLNTLVEGMISVDENLKITHFNSVLLEKFSIDETRLLGMDIRDIGYFQIELSELELSITENRQIIKTALLGERILEIIMVPIEDEKNHSVGAVILFKDITEMEKLENLRKDYVANVSHELRSPLTAIRGLIEPLMDCVVKDESDIQRYYQIIYQESLRLSRLVDDIMELSRLQSHESVIRKNFVDLNLVFEMVYERYKLFDESIQFKYTPQELPLVYSNYDRIEQILVILLDNAFKFTPENGEIALKTELKEDHVIVKVIDNGIGISKEDLPFVFQRFYKSDKSRTKKGTGLGLSIAKEILFIMGESISVNSILNEGTEFSFTLHLK